MKTSLKALVVFVLGLYALAPASIASAGGGGSFNFRGPSVLADFYYADPSGCIYTDVFVSASEATVRDVPGQSSPLSFASVSILQYDACSETQLLYAYGATNPLGADDLTISSRLNTASLQTSVSLFDEMSGNSFNVAVDLAWTGAGSISRQRARINDISPGCHVIQRWSGTSRPAVALGTVSDGVTNFSEGTSQYATIDMVRSGMMMKGCESPEPVTGAGGGISDSTNLKGPAASALFSTTDASGCVNTDVFVSASGGSEKTLPGRATPIHVASVSIYKYDTCTGAQLMDAVGLTDSLAADDFQVSKQLQSATLKATIDLDDLVSGNTFPVDVDLSWTGTGTLARSQAHSNAVFTGCHIISRWHGTGREAVATGTVSDGTTEFAPAASLYAEIAFIRSGFQVRGCE